MSAAIASGLLLRAASLAGDQEPVAVLDSLLAEAAQKGAVPELSIDNAEAPPHRAH